MAKKFNLREFQTTLSQQLQAAASRDNTGSRLGFRVGDTNWLVSLNDTEEVVPLPPIVKVPGARRWFRGVANIRGNLYAVTDFRRLHGAGGHAGPCRVPAADPAPRFWRERGPCWFAGTLGLRNINRYQLRDETAAHPWIARQYADEAGAAWRDLDFGQLLGNADFLKVESQFGN